MHHKNHIITVFEHQSLRTTDKGNIRLTEKQREALEHFHGVGGVPYFSLIHKGVRFCEYVGIIQVGNTIIEVLPKADRNSNEETWRRLLIEMLKTVGLFDIHAPSSTTLSLQSNSILDLYFFLFITEVEQLLHKGLIKRYNKIESNSTSLKGNLQFAKHLQKNIVNAEHFYVRYTTYNHDYAFNQILFKTLSLLKKINQNSSLHSRIGALLLRFPPLNDIKVDDAFFQKLNYNRKTEPYRKAMIIAKLLLLNYHPDITRGRNDVLALMFDMNFLWEKFVLKSIEKHKPKGITVHGQIRKQFWKPLKGYETKLIPDIVINKDKDGCIVLDTKWKNIGTSNPSSGDLQQMYAYVKFYKATKAVLIYPGEKSDYVIGKFYNEENNTELNGECGVLTIESNKNVQKWQKQIANAVFNSKL